jgi:hypothetical protein
VVAAAVGMSLVWFGHRHSDSVTDGWAPHNFDFFSNLSKTGSSFKIQNGCRHPIPNTNRAKNPGSDSTFESLMNFKRGLNLSKKFGKFHKILS